MNLAVKIIIDPDNELIYGLQGNIVTMNANFDIIKNGIIWISKGNILKLTKKRDGIPAENIASELEMSKSLVRQYVEIVEDLAKGTIGEKE